jgi:(S)-2-hydroxyglutarate dehydrogenase
MQYDIVIIGGGIAGLAVAYNIKMIRPGLKITLLEKEDELAVHQAGNTGIIHSGIYYKPGSLKALYCISGYSLLLEFCNTEHIPYELCGKLIVATNTDELSRLDDLYQWGLQNGLSEVRKVNSHELKEFEPCCSGVEGIWVPYSGIIDYKDVCEKLATNFVEHYQGEIVVNENVVDINTSNHSCEVITFNKTYKTRLVINTAGLYSDKIALMTRHLDMRIVPFRREYFDLKENKCSLVKSLIYPVPDTFFPFLGFHFNRRIKGGVEIGSNPVFSFRKEGNKKTDFRLTESFESIAWPGVQRLILKNWKTGLEDYYQSFNRNGLTKSLQQFLPSIQKDDLIQGRIGVRGLVCNKEGNFINDFLILEEPHVIHVLNAAEPVGTAVFAIGKVISGMVLNRL